MCFVRYKLSVLTISSYRVVVFLRRCVVYVLFITYVWYVVEDGCTLGGGVLGVVVNGRNFVGW